MALRASLHRARSWRVGWVALHDRSGALADIRRGLFSVTQLVLGANALVVSALPAILTPAAGSADATALRDFHAATLATLEAQANFVAERLRAIPGLRVVSPQGAMYVMVGLEPDLAATPAHATHFVDIDDDVSFGTRLLAEENVAVLPGACFRIPQFFRIVFCAPLPVLADACRRIAAFCDRHRRATTLWFGGYHHGVSICHVSPTAGGLPGVAPYAPAATRMQALPNPSYMAFHDDLVAAVSETADGRVTITRVPRGAAAVADAPDGSHIASCETGGADPCHLVFSPGGGYVLVANYSCDRVTIAKVGRGSGGGGDGDAPTISLHGVVAAGEHPHQIVFADPHHVLIPCLGVDYVAHYVWDEAAGSLTPFAPQPRLALPRGAGPRHVALVRGFPLHRLYVFNELDCTVSLFLLRDEDYVAARPSGDAAAAGDGAAVSAPTPLLTASTLPEAEPFCAGWSGAHIIAHQLPGGTRAAFRDVIMASNRGHNSLVTMEATFHVGGDGASGGTSSAGAVIVALPGASWAVALRPISWERGVTEAEAAASAGALGRLAKPRDFALDPSGRLLVVANQNGADALVYSVEQGEGAADVPKLRQVGRVALPAASGPCFVGFRS